MHTHRPKFGVVVVVAFFLLPVQNFFLASFLFFSPALLLSVSFALYILSGRHKKLSANYGQILEMGP